MIIREIVDAPWKAQNELRRFLAWPAVRLLFARHRISWGAGWRIYGLPIIQKHRGSRMDFGPGLQLRSFVRSNPLGPNHPVILTTRKREARLEVGAKFAMTSGVLCASSRIRIGDNVVIGTNSAVVDTDFHPVDSVSRITFLEEGLSEDVVIEDDVFIGMNCLILKGVTIGRGSIIGAGSVVAGNVPARAVFAGNPARLIKEI